MAIETIIEQTEPDAERDNPTLHAHATATIKRLLEEYPKVGKEIKDTLRAQAIRALFQMT